MKRQLLEKAIELAEQTGHVFVATTDAAGLPHLAAAGQISAAEGGQVFVRSWFCPGTVQNLQDNPMISLTAWDAKTDGGFQLLGKVESIRECGILDGYDVSVETTSPSPQVERELLVRIKKVIRFSHAPHSDVEE